MPETFLPEKMFDRLAQYCRSRRFPASLALLLTVMSLLLAFPDFSRYDPASLAWQTITLKAGNLTHTLAHLEPESWLAKKVFRLSVPVFMRVTGAPPAVVLALQYVCGLLLFLFGYRLARRVLTDDVAAVFFTAAMAFTYFGRAAFYDVGYLWFDGIAYFLLLMAMYARMGWSVFLFATAAAWTDERAFMALSVVMLFHWMDKGRWDRRTLPDGLRNPRLLAALAAAVGYLAVRTWLQVTYGMKTPGEGAHWQVIRHTWPHLPLGSWTFLEGFWLAACLFLLVSWSKREFLLPLLAGCILLVFTLTAASVYDVTRSGSFALPVVFVMGRHLGSRLGKKDLRSLYFSVFAVSLLFPPIFVCSDWGPIQSLSTSVFVKWLFYLL
ncbi:MAG: hypothetical protein RLY31_1398 [Bacteroidota bacterium]